MGVQCYSVRSRKEKSNIQNSLTPREIVSELDRFVVGQNNAKRAVAIALSSAGKSKPAKKRKRR